jgi:glycyl-tRNA synthetase alpha chain
LKSFGIKPIITIRFVEVDGNHTLGPGASGGGVVDGMEITQFTFFQQAGGITLSPVCVEITYGRALRHVLRTSTRLRHQMEREHIYGDVFLDPKGNFIYNFEESDPPAQNLFDHSEGKVKSLRKPGAYLPAYDCCLKCSHVSTFSTPAAPSAGRNAPIHRAE